MNKYLLIRVGICAVVLLILGTLSNVVGHRSTAIVDSPLFWIRSQRMLNQTESTVVPHYLGMGKRGENDTTPPMTICSLNPPQPDGENDWYVSTITVLLNATDDDSGVNITKYKVDGAAWQVYVQPFDIASDDSHHVIRYYSIDNAGNAEPQKSVSCAMDRTKPTMFLTYNVTGGNVFCGWVITLYAEADDAMSGMNRAEFYLNEILQDTIVGPGPVYMWDYPSSYEVKGFIRDPEITDEFVKFYARLVMISGFDELPNARVGAFVYDNAGNHIWDEIEQPSFRLPIIKPGFYLFREMTLRNDYTGYIGRYFISATFENT